MKSVAYKFHFHNVRPDLARCDPSVFITVWDLINDPYIHANITDIVYEEVLNYEFG